MRLTVTLTLFQSRNNNNLLNVHIELHKGLHNVLQKLALETDVQEIGQLIWAVLENADLQDTHVPIELPDSDLGKILWCEGTEGLATLTEDELWTHLGLDKKQLPFFNEFTDPDAIIEPWTEDGEKWLASKSSNCEPLQPCWHQLVRIYCTPDGRCQDQQDVPGHWIHHVFISLSLAL